MASGRQGLTNVVNARATHRHQYSEQGSLLCEKECMIIGAFGTRPDEMKAVRKKSSRPDGDYLSGVHQDIDKVQELIRKDSKTELIYSCADFPLEGGLRPKEEYLDKITKLLVKCKKPGALIWYSGHGQEDTGNWCFSDDVLTFDEIWELYLMHFRGRLLYIVTDCCYSGQWVHRLAEKLDAMQVPACGHYAKREEILLKIFASCQPDQEAYDASFSESGVFYSDKNRCITFWGNKELEEDQVTCYIDTTKVRCFRSPEESCQFSDLPHDFQWSWEDLLNNDGHVYTIRGMSQGRQAWHYLLVRKHQEESFLLEVDTGRVNVTYYGHVLYSRLGEDPPKEIKERYEIYAPD